MVTLHCIINAPLGVPGGVGHSPSEGVPGGVANLMPVDGLPGGVGHRSSEGVPGGMAKAKAQAWAGPTAAALGRGRKLSLLQYGRNNFQKMTVKK